MVKRFSSRALLQALLATLVLAAPAGADLVFLSNGRSLSVKAHRVDGAQIVLTLRSGGELVCDAALVDRIEPDEVAWPEPPTPAPAVVTAASGAEVADAAASAVCRT